VTREAIPRGAVGDAASPGAAHPVHVESVGSGPPLVLLHGWALHSGLFAPIVPDLARRFRVHAVDLPGHGHSPPVAPYTLDRVVAAVDVALAAHAEPLTVLGWSLGGVVAQRWALLRPERVARLVLVCTTPRFVNGDGWIEGIEAGVLRQFADELRVAYPQTLRRFLKLQVQGGGDGGAALAALRLELFARGEPAPAVLDEALDILAGTDLRADAARIRVPALVVTGSRDALTPPGAGAWLAATMPGATLAAIEGAAHAPFLSHRREFDAALAEFLGPASPRREPSRGVDRP
jgi:pimeloyl-[acyl-carrier protein] methyl ester esterase